MSGRVIPSKFMHKDSKIGVDSFRDVTVERVRLQPVASSSQTVFRPDTLNKISFKIPCFSQSFMDTSRSFISMEVACSNTNVVGMNFSNNLNLFNRIVIRSSSGVTLEDINNAEILSKLLMITNENGDHKQDEGVFGNRDPTYGMATSSKTVIFRFSTGILSKFLSSYLPLWLMDGGSGNSALELDLYLSKPEMCLVATTATAAIGASYTITNPIYNICLLKLDSNLCSKFDSIICDENESIEIDYTTFHSHAHVLGSQKNIISIHENATCLRRIWSVFLDTVQAVDNKQGLHFHGSLNDTDAKKQVVKYNYKVGTQNVYNEAVEEVHNNSVSMQYVKDSLWNHDKPLLIMGADTQQHNNFESGSSGMYTTVASFNYSQESEKGIIQGISSSSPIQHTVDFKESPANELTCYNFAEVTYKLKIQKGVLSFLEPKAGSQSVY